MQSPARADSARFSVRVSVSAVSRLSLLAVLTAGPATAQEVGTELGLLTLPTVSVTANRVATPLAEVGSAVTVITREQLEQHQTAHVADVLRTVPGLAVGRTGTVGNLTQVRIRGAESNQTLVLIDGIEVNDPSGGSEFDFGHLLAADIERIEVLRGPQSALYGSDAVGGVINIVTRRGRGPATGSASLQGGSFGTVQGGASLGGSWGGGDGERVDAFGSVAGFRTEGVSSASEWRGNAEADGYRNGTAFAKLGVDALDNLRVDVVGRYTAFETETDGYVGGAGAIDADEGSEGHQVYGRAAATLSLLDGRWTHAVGIAHTGHETDSLSAGVTTGTNEGRKLKLDYQTDVTAATTALVPATHAVTLAVEHERESVISQSAFADVDRTIETQGYVGQYRLGLAERLFLTGSVRHDANELFADTTTWRATGAFHIDETDTKLRASWGTGVKNPTMFELYGYTSTFTGNPNLTPEHGEGWDAGVDQSFLDGRVLLEATWFEQRIDDLITGAGNTAINLSGESRSRGLELAVTVRPLPDLAITGAWTHMSTRDPNGNRLVRRPNDTASLNATYTFLDRRATADLGIVYNGPQTDYAFDAVYNRSIVELPGYTVVNLAGSYRVTDGLELFGRVENLFDEQYEEVYTYGSPGRAGYVGVRARF